MERREFRQVSRTGKTHIWTIEVVGAEIHTTYGEEGGKLQIVVDRGVAKNAGRSNEVTPEEDALYEAGRAILMKTRTGYTEAGSERATGIDWNTTLPINLRFYKPDNTLSAALTKKLVEGAAWLGRKRDGECLVLVKGPDGKVDVYSRTMLRSHHLEVGQYEWRDRLVHMVDELETRTDVPPCSILLGDIVGDPEDDTRWGIASFMKSLTPETFKDGFTKRRPYLYVWDIPFWGGADLATQASIGERYGLIWDIFDPRWYGVSWFLPVEALELSELQDLTSGTPELAALEDPLELAQAYAKLQKWEGWVVVDPEGVYGDKAYNFRGKTDRPGRFCGKLKPCYELDALALFDPNNTKGNGVQGKWGTGNNRGMVGSLALYQYDRNGKLIYLCDCGGGIDDEFRARYSDPSCYPLTVVIEYTSRTFIADGDKTNALTYPRLLHARVDKAPSECIEERL